MRNEVEDGEQAYTVPTAIKRYAQGTLGTITLGVGLSKTSPSEFTDPGSDADQ